MDQLAFEKEIIEMDKIRGGQKSIINEKENAIEKTEN